MLPVVCTVKFLLPLPCGALATTCNRRHVRDGHVVIRYGVVASIARDVVDDDKFRNFNLH